MSNEQDENKKERRPFAPGLCFSKLVWVFLISCVVGFLVETLWCYIRHGYIESRQSLVYGPFLWPMVWVQWYLPWRCINFEIPSGGRSFWCLLW